ncbi:MAG: DUF4143 domain-containing protein [Deltaproteobacteria bacterium]|nr:DUF4143 domain-containing protein [Deltaproteobacteria bacterium]
MNCRIYRKFTTSINFAFIFAEDIHFYRTISKSEVDFIIKNGNRLIPIEVKFRKMVSIPVSMRNFGKNMRKNWILMSSLHKQNLIFTTIPTLSQRFYPHLLSGNKDFH